MTRSEAREAALYRAWMAVPEATDLRVARTERRGPVTIVRVEGQAGLEILTLQVTVARDRSGHIWGKIDREVRAERR